MSRPKRDIIWPKLKNSNGNIDADWYVEFSLRVPETGKIGVSCFYTPRIMLGSIISCLQIVWVTSRVGLVFPVRELLMRDWLSSGISAIFPCSEISLSAVQIQKKRRGEICA